MDSGSRAAVQWSARGSTSTVSPWIAESKSTQIGGGRMGAQRYTWMLGIALVVVMVVNVLLIQNGYYRG